MRFSPYLLLVALAALAACSSTSNGADVADAGGAAVDEDGSTAGCTSLGGTCSPSSAPGCPPLEQNSSLCGNVILVCCLPPGSLEGVLGIDAAGAPDSSVTGPVLDAGTDAPPTLDATVD
jgi:hypothetical protein